MQEGLEAEVLLVVKEHVPSHDRSGRQVKFAMRLTYAVLSSTTLPSSDALSFLLSGSSLYQA